MKTKNIPNLFVLIIITLLVQIGSASTNDSVIKTFSNHELFFGLGNGASFEGDVFNVPNDVDGSPDLAINFGYNYNINNQWALGLHIYGFAKTFDYLVGDQFGNVYKINFTLDTYNTGAKLKYYFKRGKFQPYSFFVLSLASGSAKSDSGKISYSGFSTGGGFGALYQFTTHFGMSADGILSIGTAKWKQKPFINSSSNDFNPGLFTFLINVLFLWGK